MRQILSVYLPRALVGSALPPVSYPPQGGIGVTRHGLDASAKERPERPGSPHAGRLSRLPELLPPGFSEAQRVLYVTPAEVVTPPLDFECVPGSHPFRSQRCFRQAASRDEMRAESLGVAASPRPLKTRVNEEPRPRAFARRARMRPPARPVCPCSGDRWPAGALQLLPSPEALVEESLVDHGKKSALRAHHVTTPPAPQHVWPQIEGLPSSADNWPRLLRRCSAVWSWLCHTCVTVLVSVSAASSLRLASLSSKLDHAVLSPKLSFSTTLKPVSTRWLYRCITAPRAGHCTPAS